MSVQTKTPPFKKLDLVILAFFIGGFLRCLSSWQGIDAIDSGFCNTFYQQIFHRPDSMPFYFCYYLTGFLGGCWHYLLGTTGMLGLRFFEVITMSAAVVLLYASFKAWIPSKSVAVMAICLSFLFPSFVITFHYNTLTYFLLSASVYSLMRWTKGYHILWLLLSGFFVGICFFARIVNISFVCLCLVPFAFGCSESLRRGQQLMLYHALGMVLGVGAVVCLLLVTGHLPYFQEGLMAASGFLQGSETTHTSGNLLSVYLGSWFNVALQMFALVAIAVSYVWAYRHSGWWYVFLRSMLLLGLLVLVITSLPYLSALAACLLLIGAVGFRRTMPLTLKVLLAYVLVAACLFPIGSDIGAQGMFHWYGGLLVIPAACCVMQPQTVKYHRYISWLYVFVAIGLISKMWVPYGEERPRTELTSRALDQLLNVCTTNERACSYQNIVRRINQYDTANPYLLIGNQASELYYATNRIPFTGNTQMETFVGTSLMRQLDNQQRRYASLPLVAFIKRGHDDPAPDNYQETLYPWLKSHHYEKVYEDEDLILFTSKNN